MSTDQAKALLNVVRPGDCIRIRWRTGREQKNNIYGRGGLVVQVTDRGIYFRCLNGYVCGVSLNHIISGIADVTLEAHQYLRNCY